MKDALGDPIFKNISDFAILALTLPISNAAVERIFSILNLVKDKLRNRMAVKMLNAILHIRSYCNVRNMCCNTFKPTQRMYLLHNNSMYPQKKEKQVNDGHQIPDLSDANEEDEEIIGYEELLEAILDLKNGSTDDCYITLYDD